MVFECPAMQPVRKRYPALFSPAQSTMQLFMWQHDIVGVASWIVWMPLVPSLMLLMMHQSHLLSPGGWMDTFTQLSSLRYALVAWSCYI